MKLNNVIFLSLILMLSQITFASEVDPVFKPATGTLILPNLLLNGEIFYVELELVDPVNLLFKVDVPSIVNITPADNYVDPGKSAILGTWKEVGTDEMTFNSDGTYTYLQLIPRSGCPSGTESGTYQWESSTGFFAAQILEDHNGQCGLGGDGHAVPDFMQGFVNGNTLTFKFRDENGVVMETENGAFNKIAGS